MRSRYLLLGAVAVLLVLAGCTQGNGDQPVRSGEVQVDITASGFDPQQVTVEQGTTVTWTNQRSSAAWPASNVHPTHTQYPGGDYGQSGSYAGSQGCTGENQPKGDAFDACHQMEQGASWSFTFNETGEWRYHDHMRPNFQGVVTVVG